MFDKPLAPELAQLVAENIRNEYQFGEGVTHILLRKYFPANLNQIVSQKYDSSFPNLQL